MPRKILRGRTPDDLIRAIYKAEGWTFREGERRVARCKELYELTSDAHANRYIATPKET